MAPNIPHQLVFCALLLSALKPFANPSFFPTHTVARPDWKPANDTVDFFEALDSFLAAHVPSKGTREAIVANMRQQHDAVLETATDGDVEIFSKVLH